MRKNKRVLFLSTVVALALTFTASPVVRADGGKSYKLSSESTETQATQATTGSTASADVNESADDDADRDHDDRGDDDHDDDDHDEDGDREDDDRDKEEYDDKDKKRKEDKKDKERDKSLMAEFEFRKKALEQEYQKLKKELEAQKETLSGKEYEALKKELKAQWEAAKDELEAEKDAAEQAIKEERGRILGEYKGRAEELKKLADELKKQLEAGIGAEDEELLESAAAFYEQAGALQEALQAQKEAVKRDLKNLSRYKKLASMLEKEGQTGVKAFVNGEMPAFEVPPMIKEGSTLVPFRAISEALQAEVKWNAEEQSVTVIKDGQEVKLFIGQAKAYVNGREVTLEVPASIEQGSTFVPVRFISEALGADVQWEAETQSVVIVEEAAAAEADGTVGAESASGDDAGEAAAQEDSPAPGVGTESTL
ncbi:stalk domain-containing protein [Paenibacillus caseinilyticus]|uniref:Copper amine oxidase domain-containing protein n=1 Tax=Paenibacillus mucilaginosus K02 TaxID=997761 RepID=V9IR96_9BACL|nr:copper amine oxidase N-terminal domain-containing protein [Paenibacillus mucilaginosus]AFK65360.1 copper amine oxidase domain-containing protein [Paenibacillus mucilaginosus K02]